MRYSNIASWENANPYEDLDIRTEEEIEEDLQREAEYYEFLDTFEENQDE